jgi:hypothetical protein
MNPNNISIYLLDGLPPTRKVDAIMSAFRAKNIRLHYFAFEPHLNILTNKDSIDTLLKNYLTTVNDENRILVASSFGAYLLIHRASLLNTVSGLFNRIILLSPFARLTDIPTIGSLPNYLNQQYGSSLSADSFRTVDKQREEIDHIVPKTRKTITIYLGKDDPEIDWKKTVAYFKDFHTVVLPGFAHLGSGSLLENSKLYGLQ